MTIKDIYNLAVEMGIKADPRGGEEVQKDLKRRKRKFDELSDKEKQEFDKESLKNPYSDTRILNIAKDIEIKKVLVGIDIEIPELLLSKEIDDIDLIISHHPEGIALAQLSKVMDIQADILAKYGVPINAAEILLREEASKYFRKLLGLNHQRTVDAARILGLNLMCSHTACDNLVVNFLADLIDNKKPERLEDLISILKDIPEYKKAVKLEAGPKIFVGENESRCGKIIVDMTGGLEGSPKNFEIMAQAGIGTVVGMHYSEEHIKKARKGLVNIIVAGHMSSDSLGVNLFLDEIEKKGIEIIPCSGLIRISRNSK